MNIKKQGVSVIKPDFSASFLDYELILNVQLKQYHIVALLLLFICAVLNHSVIALFGGLCFSYFLHDAAKTEFLSYGKKLLSL